jgi:septal ring factor EnvC (AmiA/AmiB activator)
MKQQFLEAENRSLKQSLEVRTAALTATQKALECCLADLYAMRDERDSLRAALAKEKKAHEATIDQRDRAETNLPPSRQSTL